MSETALPKAGYRTHLQHLSFESIEGSMESAISQDWPYHDPGPPEPWLRHHALGRALRRSSEPSQSVANIESRLDEFVKSLKAAIDIGLENRKLLEQLHERESRVGLGAIHSLDHGQAQLSYPLIYSYQMVEDEVVVGIEEFGVYGVGATEGEAVEEVQDELWSLFQELNRVPPEELGAQLIRTLRALRARIQHHAVDA